MLITQTILNILIVSIPEEFFITMLILILLGRWEFLSKEFWKENIKKIILISVLPVAIMTNMLKYWNVNTILSFIINITIFGITIITLTQTTKIKNYIKIFIMSGLSLIIFAIIELTLLFVILYTLKVDASIINQSAFINAEFVIPERIVEYGFLMYVFIKRNSLTQINISQMIFSNIWLRRLSFIFTVIDALIIGIVAKFYIFEQVLHTLLIQYQILIIIVTLSLIILNLFPIWITAICIYPVEKYKQNKLKEEFSYEKEHDE